MGCGNANIFLNFKQEEKENYYLKFKYEKFLKKYNDAIQKGFTLLNDDTTKDFLRTIEEINGSDLMKNIKDFYSSNHRKLNSLGFRAQGEFEYSILLDLSKKHLTTTQESSIKEIDLFQISNELLKKNYTDFKKPLKCYEKIIKELKDFILEAEKNIPSKIKFYSLFIEKDYSVTKHYHDLLYEHLLFDSKFLFEGINIYMTSLFFSSERVEVYFREILKRVKPLFYVSLIINSTDINNKKEENFNLNPQMYGTFINLMKSINENETIKFFALSIEGFNKIVAPPEICSLLIKFLKKDVLFGFYLGKWVFSKAFYTEFFEILQDLKNLRLLILNVESNSKEFKTNLNNALSFNTSLQVVFYSGVDYSEHNIENERLKTVVKTSKQMVSFYHSPDIKNLECVGKEEVEDIHEHNHSSNGVYIIPEL